MMILSCFYEVMNDHVILSKTWQTYIEIKERSNQTRMRKVILRSQHQTSSSSPFCPYFFNCCQYILPDEFCTIINYQIFGSFLLTLLRLYFKMT